MYVPPTGRFFYGKIMIEAQNIPVRQIQNLERSALTLLDMIEQTSQKELFQVLYNRELPISSATPEGFMYAPLKKELTSSYRPIRIGYFGPHPSDLPDFIGGITSQLQNASMHEFLLTEGELGAEPLSPQQTKIVRRGETLHGAEILGNSVKVLSDNEQVLPDGDVLTHLATAARLVKQTIQEEDLSIIIAPGPEVDHPDHVATYLAVTQALLELRDEGYLEGKELPALYLTDPEYGYSSGENWAKEKVKEIIWDYPYLVDKEIFVLPDFIIDISKGMQQAVASLLMHDTQMNGKEYLWKIPMLKRVRGQQIGKSWGEALRQIVIPNTTQQNNLLLDYLPEESMFALHRSPGNK